MVAAAAAGDVRLTADARNHDGRVQLDLPTGILRDPAEVTTTDGTRLDLAEVVREVGAMPEGGSRTLDVGAAHLVFTHRPVPARGVTRLRVAITVARGRGASSPCRSTARRWAPRPPSGACGWTACRW